MHIAVCDDLQGERAYIIQLIKEYFQGQGIDVSEYDSGEALLSAFNPGMFSLVFLDIFMKGITGVETARRLKEMERNCQIIFMTTSREYGAEAYDLEAFHYLVKPIEKQKLFAVLGKWYSIFCDTKTIVLKYGRTKREVLICDVIYVEVFGRSSSVHTKTETIETQMSLSVIETLLPPEEFCRPIRYSLVSLRHIRNIGGEFLVMDNGEQLPFSRRERGNLREKLAAYRLRQLRR